MQLFFSPGACSLASHIALIEAGADFGLIKVSTKTHQTEGGEDFYAINPKGYVPVLRFDNGEILTEGPAILQFIADTHPEAGLAPPPGGLPRARLQEHLTFIGTEIHKAFSPLFNPSTPDDGKAAARDKIGNRFDLVETQLSDGRAYLLGDQFSVADAYLYVVAGWGPKMGVPLDRWPNLSAHGARVAARPATKTALAAEA